MIFHFHDSTASSEPEVDTTIHPKTITQMEIRIHSLIKTLKSFDIYLFIRAVALSAHSISSLCTMVQPEQLSCVLFSYPGLNSGFQSLSLV